MSKKRKDLELDVVADFINTHETVIASEEVQGQRLKMVGTLNGTLIVRHGDVVLYMGKSPRVATEKYNRAAN